MSNCSPEISIAPFRRADQDAVKQLILQGLGEHWGRIDPTRNPDLDDIAATYANGTTLVAWQTGKIVGTGTLAPHSPGTGQILRVSVAAQLRRRGIGHAIVKRLVEVAREAGYKRVILETTATWAEVIAFYQRFGFRITHCAGGDVYLELIID